MFPSIHLGFADIPTYRTIFLAGFFIAIVIARKIAGRYRLAKEDVLYGAIYAAIGILIGSKLLYCLTRLPSLIQKWDAVAAGFDKNFMQTLLFLSLIHILNNSFTRFLQWRMKKITNFFNSVNVRCVNFCQWFIGCIFRIFNN